MSTKRPRRHASNALAMKIAWSLILLLWAIPAASLLACPYDLHGFSTCSSVAQFGRATSFYLVAPGMWFGSALSSIVQGDLREGVSGLAILVGVVIWLGLLSAILLFVAKRLTRLTSIKA